MLPNVFRCLGYCCKWGVDYFRPWVTPILSESSFSGSILTAWTTFTQSSISECHMWCIYACKCNSIHMWTYINSVCAYMAYSGTDIAPGAYLLSTQSLTYRPGHLLLMAWEGLGRSPAIRCRGPNARLSKEKTKRQTASKMLLSTMFTCYSKKCIMSSLAYELTFTIW